MTGPRHAEQLRAGHHCHAGHHGPSCGQLQGELEGGKTWPQLKNEAVDCNDQSIILKEDHFLKVMTVIGNNKSTEVIVPYPYSFFLLLNLLGQLLMMAWVMTSVVISKVISSTVQGADTAQ